MLTSKDINLLFCSGRHLDFYTREREKYGHFDQINFGKTKNCILHFITVQPYFPMSQIRMPWPTYNVPTQVFTIDTQVNEETLSAF